MKRILYAVICLWFPHSLWAYSSGVDSLNSAETKLTTLYGLIAKHSYTPAKALAYAQQAIQIAWATGNKEALAKSHSLAGNMCLLAMHNKQALRHFRTSLQLRQQMEDIKKIALSLDNLGLVHEQMGNTMQALKYYKASLKLNRQIKNQFAIASNLSNIAGTYRKQNNYAQAVSYYQKSLNTNKLRNSKTAVSLCLNNITITQIYARKSR